MSYRLHLWRALIRFESVDIVARIASFTIPGWNPGVTVTLPFRAFPPEVVDLLQIPPGFPAYMHAEVNLGADNVSELVFDNWELQ